MFLKKKVSFRRITTVKETIEIFEPYGIKAEELQGLLAKFRQDPESWVDFMMRFELNLEKPEKNRSWISALTIGLSYFIGGLVPLAVIYQLIL